MAYKLVSNCHCHTHNLLILISWNQTGFCILTSAIFANHPPQEIHVQMITHFLESRPQMWRERGVFIALLSIDWSFNFRSESCFNPIILAWRISWISLVWCIKERLLHQDIEQIKKCTIIQYGLSRKSLHRSEWKPDFQVNKSLKIFFVMVMLNNL